MVLLKGEKIQSTSNDGFLKLSNLRVQYENKVWGKTKTTSILLKNISSIEITYKSNPIFVALAVLVLLSSFIEGTYILYGSMLSILFILLFLLSRKHYLIIASKGGSKITLLIKGMKTASILEFLNKIEYHILYNH